MARLITVHVFVSADYVSGMVRGTDLDSAREGKLSHFQGRTARQCPTGTPGRLQNARVSLRAEV